MTQTTCSDPALPPVALTIAGSDSSGGAGLQADLKTFTVLGVFGTSVVTAITAQNTVGVQDAHLVEVDLISRQIDAVADDFLINATKTGMLASAAIIDVVADRIEAQRLKPLVVDPVMVAKSGDPLIDDAAVSRMADRMLPLATLTTPNRYEAARLLGSNAPAESVEQAGRMAERICNDFAAACIVKGIRRMKGDRQEVVDVLFENGTISEHAAPWVQTNRTHGSGCTFSAAITAALAIGRDLPEAITQARTFISRAIAQAPPLGHGHPPVAPLAWRG